MNGNYQLNEFYVKEKMADHKKAAKTRRLSQLAGHKGTLQLVAEWVFRWLERLVDYGARSIKRISTRKVSIPSLDLNKS